MNYVLSYQQWYCNYCQQYQQPLQGPGGEPPQAVGYQAPPPYGGGYPQMYPPAPRPKSNTVVIVIVVIVVVIVVVGILAYAFLFFWASELASTSTEEAASFPTVEMALETDGVGYNYLEISHRSGGPIDWSEFRITIEDTADSSNSAVISNIFETQDVLETFTFTNDVLYLAGTYTSDIEDVILFSGDQYEITIYNIYDGHNVLVKDITCVSH